MEYRFNNSIKPSPTEQILIKRLREKNIYYIREVEFDGCVNPLTGHNLRYDFYLPHHNILIEYDGKQFHQEGSVKQRDAIKTRFAEDNGIALIRLSNIPAIAVWINSNFRDLLKEKPVVKKSRPVKSVKKKPTKKKKKIQGIKPEDDPKNWGAKKSPIEDVLKRRAKYKYPYTGK